MNKISMNEYKDHIMLITACKRRHTDVVDAIIRADAKIPKDLIDKLIHDAASKGNSDVVITLLRINNVF